MVSVATTQGPVIRIFPLAVFVDAAIEPIASDAAENGSPVVRMPDAPTVTDVAPVRLPLTVTCRPIFVYVPSELAAPANVAKAVLGVQVPSW